MIEKDLGFIIRRHNFRNTSIIANVYTKRFGKIAGIFKGFYTQKKEFSSPLENFTLNEFVFYPKSREIWLVSFADLAKDYAFLKTDIDRSMTAGILFSLLDKVMQAWDPNPQVFDLLAESMRLLEQGENRKALYVFLIKFLTFSGFQPQLSVCINCHQELDEALCFSASRGGLLCKVCSFAAVDAYRISRETSSSLLYIQGAELSLAARLNPSQAAQVEMFSIIEQFLNYHLGLDFGKRLPLNRVDYVGMR
jgi:DNA repair protein RecO (recombination protein O)